MTAKGKSASASRTRRTAPKSNKKPTPTTKSTADKRAASKLAAIEQRCAAAPREVAPRLELAAALLKTGAVERAIDLLREGIAAEPAEARFHNLLATTYLLQGKGDEAIRELEQSAVHGGPSAENTRLRAAFLLDHRVNRPAEARAALESLYVKGDAADEAGLCLLLRAELATGDKAAGFATARRLLLAGTTDVNALVVVAQAALHEGKAAALIELIGTLPKPTQNHPAIAALLWSAHAQLGDQKSATLYEGLARRGVPSVFSSASHLRRFVNEITGGAHHG